MVTNPQKNSDPLAEGHVSSPQEIKGQLYERHSTTQLNPFSLLSLLKSSLKQISLHET